MRRTKNIRGKKRKNEEQEWEAMRRNGNRLQGVMKEWRVGCRAGGKENRPKVKCLFIKDLYLSDIINNNNICP